MGDLIFRKSFFFKSVTNLASFPKDCPVVLFLGRSNVGKSSLINALCRNKSLMKTSKTPGRTQLLNLVSVDDFFYICDAPGYGFAAYERDSFGELVSSLLESQNSLSKVYILVDSRRFLMPADEEFIAYLSTKAIPFSIVFTKTDKLNKTETGKLVQSAEGLSCSCFYVSNSDSASIQRLRTDIYSSVRTAIAGKK